MFVDFIASVLLTARSAPKVIDKFAKLSGNNKNVNMCFCLRRVQAFVDFLVNTADEF